MGQKVNPHGLRVGVIKDWDSRWFAKDNAFGDILVEDYQLRKYLKKRLAEAGVPKIEIERDAAKVKISIHCSRPVSLSAVRALRSKRSARNAQSLSIRARKPPFRCSLTS